MRVLSCCVVGCSSSSSTRDANSDLTFHKLPLVSEELTKQLTGELGHRNDATFNYQKALICSLHFDVDSFTIYGGPFAGRRLKKSAWPTLHLPGSSGIIESDTNDSTSRSSAESQNVDRAASTLTQMDLNSSLPSNLSRFSDEEILFELSQRQAAFVCVCGMIFQDRALYYMHRSCHDPSQPLKCAFCNLHASDWLKFHSHFANHSFLCSAKEQEIVEID